MSEEKNVSIPIQEELRNIQNSLLRECDEQIGIESKIKNSTFERDATKAKLIGVEERLLPDQDVGLITRNAKLRSLCTLRGVIHALEKANQPPGLIKQLKSYFTILVEQIDKQKFHYTPEGEYPNPPEKVKQSLEELQEIFNDDLLKALAKASLMRGTESREEKRELLCLYRYLATSLDPPLTMTTTLKLPNEKLFTITSTPLTQKTEAQLKALESAIPDLEPTTKDTTSNESNFYTALNFASQQAIRAFKKEIVDPTKTLPAQMRRWIPFGLKNAFVNKSIVVNNEEKEQYISAQSATLAFVGKGEVDLQSPTTLNLEQLKQEILRTTEISESTLELDILILNTSLLNHEKQQLILTTTKKAASESKNGTVNYFNVPTNWIGSHFETVKTSVHDCKETRDAGRSNKIARAEQAANIALREGGVTKVTVTLCASGQDRTNVVRLFTEVTRLQRIFSGLETQELINCLVASGHFSLMPTLLCPGSYGIKKDSIAKNRNFLGRTTSQLLGEATDHLHCELADTNKSVPILGDTYRKKTAIEALILIFLLLVLILAIASVFTSGGLFSVLSAVWLGWMALTSLNVIGSAITLVFLMAVVSGVTCFIDYQIGSVSPENHLTYLQDQLLIEQAARDDINKEISGGDLYASSEFKKKEERREDTESVEMGNLPSSSSQSLNKEDENPSPSETPSDGLNNSSGRLS